MSAIESDRVDCVAQCEIPEGVKLSEVPPSRHAWDDVLVCPNDGCDKQFLVLTSRPEST